MDFVRRIRFKNNCMLREYFPLFLFILYSDSPLAEKINRPIASKNRDARISWDLKTVVHGRHWTPTTFAVIREKLVRTAKNSQNVKQKECTLAIFSRVDFSHSDSNRTTGS